MSDTLDKTAPAPAPAKPRRPGHRRRPSPPTPVARFDPGRVAESRHRNPAWVLAGVLLVVLCALGGVLLFASADDRTEVLVAAGDLEPGEPISRGDLRIERLVIDGDVGSLSPAAADALVGLLPVGRIPAGTLLAQGMFADEVPLAPNEVVFGAALDPGEAPLSGVQVGAPVELLDVPKASPAPDQSSAPDGRRSDRDRVGHGVGRRVAGHRSALDLDAGASRRRPRRIRGVAARHPARCSDRRRPNDAHRARLDRRLARCDPPRHRPGRFVARPRPDTHPARGGPRRRPSRR